MQRKTQLKSNYIKTQTQQPKTQQTTKQTFLNPTPDKSRKKTKTIKHTTNKGQPKSQTIPNTPNHHLQTKQTPKTTTNIIKENQITTSKQL